MQEIKVHRGFLSDRFSRLFIWHPEVGWLIFFLLVMIKLPAQKDRLEKINSFKELRQSFLSPPQQYGSAPLWVWNAKVDSAQITEMLRQFKANAFGGVFIHPRAGLITPYLSKEWLDLYSFTVKEARKIALDVWIYDENSYPSGFAGGHVPAEMPESFNQSEMLEYKKTDTLPVNANDWFICLKKSGESYTDVTNHISEEKGKEGPFMLFKKTLYYQSPWYGGYSYVDLMVKGVTEKFISVTMNPYEKTIGDEFGKTVKGVFSDEPNIEVQYPNSIRWTPDLFSRFKNTWGYDLQPCLASLVEQTGEWKKIRHNYYQTLLQLFIDRWSKPYSSYAAEKNLEWTGHYWEHEWPSPNHGPDNMAMYAWPQRPGIDMLFNQFSENDVNAQFGNIRSVKELASVANQLDKKRTLSETYGGAGWDLGFNDMKRLGDWEFALGVNTLNQHLSFMSLVGARKYDYPQSFSYQTPWWPYYKYLNKYFGRLSMALSSGEQINDVLVIEPTTTAWMYFDYDHPDTVFKLMGNQFQQFITRLEHAQVEYDLGSENIIKDHGKAEGGNFVIGKRKYKTVVLPPGIENIDIASFRILQEYTKAGGRILQFSRLKTIDGSPNPRLDSFYKNKTASLLTFDSLDNQIIDKYFTHSDFHILQKNDSIGDLYHYRRKLSDGELIFLTNSSLTAWSSGRLNMPARSIQELDLYTGKIKTHIKLSGEKDAGIDFVLAPAGSVLYFFSLTPLPSDINKTEFRNKTTKIAVSPTTVIRKADNSLTLDFCDVHVGDTLLKDVHVFDAADYVFKKHGFPEGNPWNTSVQYEDHTIRRDSFSRNSGFTASYFFNIEEEIDILSLKAVVENPQLYTIKLNDRIIHPIAGKWWIDKAFKVFDIGRYAQKGRNRLTVTAVHMSIYAEIEPVYILGNFGLSSAAKGWNIVRPQKPEIGSWKNQGMALFGGEVTYFKQINILQKGNHKIVLELGKWKGTVATVRINNQFAGLISTIPFSLDISSYLKTGNNKVEVTVIGSLKNVFGPFHRKPAPGMVSPWEWRYIDHYPRGSEYDTQDYGLMEDFKILVE